MPDYLGGPEKSRTVIGEITRAVKDRIAEAEVVVQARKDKANKLLNEVDEDLLLPQRREFREDAERLLNEWTCDLAQLMRRCAPPLSCTRAAAITPRRPMSQ